MPVGNQASSAAVNQSLTTLALDLRGVCQSIRDFQTYVVTMGQSGLETLGFSAADAASVVSMASYLNTVSGVYFGTATQASQFDFDNQLSGLWAAQ